MDEASAALLISKCAMAAIDSCRAWLAAGLVIPACPLALDSQRKLDERRQRALLRYYLAAGAGGVAVGVHTTQFAIRDSKIGLFKPVLELAAEELRRQPEPALNSEHDAFTAKPESRVAIAGICGPTKQAIAEAQLVRELGYHAGLLSLGALPEASDDGLLAHCRSVAEIIPLFGFYLQPAAGGRVLPYSFWRRFAEIDNVVAIKIAPFNRYQTVDVIRAVAESGREDIVLYTGNDDNIVLDLLTPYRFSADEKLTPRRIAGGLLGHWAVWTRKAVELLAECRAVAQSEGAVPASLLRTSVEVTDCNAAFFDAANNYSGCIPGIHEVLRRRGLLEGLWCLDPNEILSPGQREEIDRVIQAYPHLNDDEFVEAHRDEWLSG
jgi:hypothetical protein